MAHLKHPALVLAVVTGLSLLPLLLLGQWGSAQIAANQRDYQIRQMQAVLSDIPYDTVLPPPALQPDATLPDTQIRALYPVYHRQRLSALVVHAVAQDGYNGDITLLLAYRSGTTHPAALRVLDHRETAGLADFLGEAPQQAFDGVSGATISAAAVTRSADAVGQWLETQWDIINQPGLTAGQ